MSKTYLEGDILKEDAFVVIRTGEKLREGILARIGEVLVDVMMIPPWDATKRRLLCNQYILRRKTSKGYEVELEDSTQVQRGTPEYEKYHQEVYKKQKDK